MCGMCKAEPRFADLERRAEAARVNDDRHALMQVENELNAVFANIEAEERQGDDFAEVEPMMRDRFSRIRRVIVGGENPASVFEDGDESENVKMFSASSAEDLMSQIQAALGFKPETPKEEEPSLEDWIMQAQVDVEKSLMRVDPIVRFVKELRVKLETDGGFSPAVAEQMAAQAFISTMGNSR